MWGSKGRNCVVIKGRSSENDQRKFVGRREAARANREAKEPQRCSRTEGVSAHPKEPWTPPRALIIPIFQMRQVRLRDC